jgi:hypothetical protein
MVRDDKKQEKGGISLNFGGRWFKPSKLKSLQSEKTTVQCSENGIGGKNGFEVRTKIPTPQLQNRQNPAHYTVYQIVSFSYALYADDSQRKPIRICYNPVMRIYRCNRGLCQLSSNHSAPS